MKKIFIVFVLLFLSFLIVGCSNDKNDKCTGIIKNAYIEEAVFVGFVGEYERHCDVTLKIEYTEDSDVGQTGIIEMYSKNGDKIYNTIFEVNESLKGGFIYREKAEFLQQVDPTAPKAQTAKVVLKVNGVVVGTATLDEFNATFG